MDEAEATHTQRQRTDIERIFTRFLQRQATVVRLVSYVEDRAVEIDDRRREVREMLTRRYGTLGNDVINSLVEIVVEPTKVGPEQTAALDSAAESKGGEIVAALLSVSYQDADAGKPVLFASLLTTLVGGFELFISDLATFAFRSHPSALVMKDATFTWDEIARHDSLESLRDQTVERFIEDLLRKSFDDWIKTFKDRFGAAVPESVTGLDVREVFQRRNIVVHNDSKVSHLYLDRMRGAEDLPALGDTLDISAGYLNEAADKLVALAWHLAWSLGSRFYKSSDDYRSFELFVCNVPYRYLESERYGAIVRQDCDHVANGVRDEANRLILRVNSWLARKRLGILTESDRSAIESWQTSYLSPQYRLAQLALLGQLADGLALVKEIRGTDFLSLISWHSWPLLAELREYERSLASDEPTGLPSAESL